MSSQNLQFDIIYQEHWNSVFRICVGYTGNEDDAKDLAQEAFVNVWKSLSTFKNNAKLSTWIFRITTNIGVMICQYIINFCQNTTRVMMYMN